MDKNRDVEVSQASPEKGVDALRGSEPLAQATTSMAKGPEGAQVPPTSMLCAFEPDLVAVEPGRDRAAGPYHSLNEVAERHGIECLQPGEVEVWYLKARDHTNPDAYFNPAKVYDPERLVETHVLLGKVKGEHPEDIWNALQALGPEFGDQHWSPNGEAADLICSRGLRHTSMDIGDVVRHPRIGAMVVAPMGFDRLGGAAPLEKAPKEPWEVQAWAQQLAKDSHVMGGKGIRGLDTETTGLDGPLIEIALVDQAGATVYHAYVEPLAPINPAATKVHGLTEERLKELGARPWAEVSKEVRVALSGHTIGQYASGGFDRRAIETTDRLAGLEVPTDPGARWFDMMDTCQAARGYHKAMKLVEVAADLGVPLGAEEAHGAVADARAMMGIFEKIREGLQKPGPSECYITLGGEASTRSLEAYDGQGMPLRGLVQRQVLEAALGRFVLSAARPDRAIETLSGGGYIRLSL